MARIEKDQLEKYLEQNQSVEEPSSAVFQRLQKEAVWNQRPSFVPWMLLAALLVMIAGLIFLSFRSPEILETRDVQNLEKNTVPASEEKNFKPVDVIAFNEISSDAGSYRLLKFKSDDFNLSFQDDSSSETLLGISREIDNI